MAQEVLSSEQTSSLRLGFGPDVEPRARARIAYAFRVFCAVYGYAAVDQGEGAGSSTIDLHYGADVPSGAIGLPSSYVARAPQTASSSPRMIQLFDRQIYRRVGIARFPCFTPLSEAGTDWLGEIFEWISAADEYAVTDRDAVGRVPFRATVHGRYGLDPAIPYAAIAMYEVNAALRASLSGENSLPRKPWHGDFSTIIAATHDLDFIPLSPIDSTTRLVKNIAKRALTSRDPRLAVEIALCSVRGLLRGRSPLNYIAQIQRRERELDIESTYNVICRQGHSRDGNYSLNDRRVRSTLRILAESGAEIAVHGSYTSLEAPMALASEFRALEQAGFPAQGIRQHWLRYSGSQFYDELERIGVRYDTSVGYSERAGFRTGACFPYPPYCFAEERPYNFLELPLAIMDGSLYDHDHSTRTYRNISERILHATRTLGWGGVSILWHNASFEGGQLPGAVGKLYWQLKRRGDRWTSAATVVDTVWDRFARPGLVHA